MASKEVKRIAKALSKKPQPELVNGLIPVTDMLSVGITLGNLALSGRTNVGLVKGTYVLIVGDTNAGKTFWERVILAEACKNPAFDDYELIEDTPEGGAKMDTAKFYGQKLADRLKAPRYDKDDRPMYSTTLEEFYDQVYKRLKAGKKFIYALDSQDVLSSEAELKKTEADMKAREKNGKIKGSFGVDKASVHSEKLRQIIPLLARTGSILIIISQTRDKIGNPIFMTGDKKTRAGGYALSFYADVEMWLSIKRKLKRKVRGNWLNIGTRSRVVVKRTRLTGAERIFEVPILKESGIDDVGACIDYLVQWNHWEGKESQSIKGEIERVSAPEFQFDGSREELIQIIEEQDSEAELKKLVKKVWKLVEAEATTKRKVRYS